MRLVSDGARFFVRNISLVMEKQAVVGQRRWYSHQTNARRICQVLDRICQFEYETFLSRQIQDTNVPVYQIAVVVSWLKQGGVLLEHRKGKYEVRNPEEFWDNVSCMWMDAGGNQKSLNIIIGYIQQQEVRNGA